jgi:integrase
VQQIIHTLFAVAVRAEWIGLNPADGIEMPGAVTRVDSRERFLSIEQVEKIVAEVEDRYKAFAWTLALGGLRPGEAKALRLRDVNGTIHVKQGKTKDSKRDVPVHA